MHAAGASLQRTSYTCGAVMRMVAGVHVTHAGITIRHAVPPARAPRLVCGRGHHAFTLQPHACMTAPQAAAHREGATVLLLHGTTPLLHAATCHKPRLFL